MFLVFCSFKVILFLYFVDIVLVRMISEVSGGADDRVHWLMSQLIASVSNFIYFLLDGSSETKRVLVLMTFLLLWIFSLLSTFSLFSVL